MTGREFSKAARESLSVFWQGSPPYCRLWQEGEFHVLELRLNGEMVSVCADRSRFTPIGGVSEEKNSKEYWNNPENYRRYREGCKS